jgi:hypothetical protein
LSGKWILLQNFFLYDDFGMNFDFKDPAILIPLGVLLIGLILFVWGIGKLFKKDTSDIETPFLPEDFPPPTPAEDQWSTPPLSEPEPAFRPQPAARATGETSVPNKEMVDRLDTMSQRLNDMQSVLQKQTSAPSGTALTAETIDKLLKIIGNVTQQVDLLQRSLGAPGSAPVPPPAMSAPVATPKSTPAPTSVATPTPAPKTVPAAAPATTTPPPAAKPPAAPAATPTTPVANTPGKKIGISGGALSSLPPQPPTTPGK